MSLDNRWLMAKINDLTADKSVVLIFTARFEKVNTLNSSDSELSHESKIAGSKGL